MKKYLIAVLVLIMAVSAPIYAEDSTVFTVEPSVNNGVVTVSVMYRNNKMMHCGEFEFVYDNKKLELIESKKGEIIEPIYSIINDAYTDNKAKVAWASAEVLPENGTVFVAKLRCVDGSFENSLLSIENFLVGNENGQNMKEVSISVKGVEGSTIYSGQATETEEKKEETTVTETRPAEDSKPAVNETPKVDTAETQQPEVNETDETLPLDKVPNEEELALGFADVAESDWFFNSVKYAKENKLMSGVSETEFAPNDSVTRAMLVVVLHRIEGEPKIGDAAFADVESGEWYTNAVAWAANEGIVNGVGDNMFAPNADITREQIATLLYKYSQKKDTVGATAVYFDAPDKDKISDWAMEGMSWAVAEKLITGKDGGVLDPGGKATRAEIATILMRFLNK